jgi:hypothetical protein
LKEARRAMAAAAKEASEVDQLEELACEVRVGRLCVVLIHLVLCFEEAVGVRWLVSLAAGL